VGQREITIYVVVFGQENRIEEDIAKLVELELGIRINADKGAIHRVLRENGLDKYGLVRHASRTNLKKALPQLDFCTRKDRKKQY